MRNTGDPASRDLGLWSAIALVVGHAIGVGIFLTPADLIGALASPVLTLGLWIICGAHGARGSLDLRGARLEISGAGGPYIYLREAWGERIAFLYGWQSLLVMDPAVTAALTTGASQYLVVLWPAAIGSERWIAVATIWILALVNMAGLRLSARVLGVMTAFKLLALAAIVVDRVHGGGWALVELPIAAGRRGPARRRSSRRWPSVSSACSSRSPASGRRAVLRATFATRGERCPARSRLASGA